MKCKKIPEGSHAHELLKYSSATLGSGNIKMAVQLPDGEDINEWIAVNSMCLYVQIGDMITCQYIVFPFANMYFKVVDVHSNTRIANSHNVIVCGVLTKHS